MKWISFFLGSRTEVKEAREAASRIQQASNANQQRERSIIA